MAMFTSDPIQPPPHTKLPMWVRVVATPLAFVLALIFYGGVSLGETLLDVVIESWEMTKEWVKGE